MEFNTCSCTFEAAGGAHSSRIGGLRAEGDPAGRGWRWSAGLLEEGYPPADSANGRVSHSAFWRLSWPEFSCRGPPPRSRGSARSQGRAALMRWREEVIFLRPSFRVHFYLINRVLTILNYSRRAELFAHLHSSLVTLGLVLMWCKWYVSNVSEANLPNARLYSGKNSAIVQHGL